MANAESVCNDWRKAVEVYERCKDEPLGELPEFMFRAFIVMGTTDEVVSALKSAGKRNGTKQFGTGDVSGTIENAIIEDLDIVVVARFLLRQGMRSMAQIRREINKVQKETVK